MPTVTLGYVLLGRDIPGLLYFSPQLLFLVCVSVSLFSCVWLFATLWTVAHQAPLSMGFSRQECWSGLPFPTPGDLSDPGLKLMYLLHWQVDPLRLHHLGSPYFSLTPDCLLFFEKEHKAIMCHGLRTTRKERICTHQLEKLHKKSVCQFGWGAAPGGASGKEPFC